MPAAAHAADARPRRRAGAGRAACPCLADQLCARPRSEEHTSELQSQSNLVCRLLLEKKKKKEYAFRSFPARAHSSNAASCDTIAPYRDAQTQHGATAITPVSRSTAVGAWSARPTDTP